MEQIIEIEKIVAGGKGLARPAQGKVVMTEFVLPGETVRVRHRKEFSHYIAGELLEILTLSPDRIQPLCPHYGECGGCNLQHADYASQLNIKQTIVHEAMTRAGVELPKHDLQDTLASPDPWGYRYRLRLQIDPSGRPGFFQKKSNSFVAVNNCPVAAPGLNKVLAELKATAALKDATDICNEIELLQSPDNNQITLVLLLTGKNKLEQEVIQAMSSQLSVDSIGYKQRNHYSQLAGQQKPHSLSQKITLPEQETSCTFSWSAACFSQVNAGQNEQLIQLIYQLAGDVRNTTLLDLYCGMGNFSLPLALLGAAVTGIEVNKESIKWAKINADTAGQTCSFFASDVASSLKQLVQDKQQVDTIVLDPPRQGMGKIIGLLPRLNPQQILYISCDPATLARDLAILCKQRYALTTLTPVDMFPQTHHIESVALLKRN